MSALQARADVTSELLPAGLFLGAGARAVDDTVAGEAWFNDRRVAQLTGQVFSEHYRQRVCGDRQQRFDSGLATLALTAVARIDPARALPVLGNPAGALCARWLLDVGAGHGNPDVVLRQLDGHRVS
ncbi:hypothetical protein ACFQS6_01190 [Xanthomonas populi]|uniref:hypothetical protein n=1 Tax=Xanthomonas populi TaxID=53414 RepID=UPI001ABFDA6B|nr:hypothetical protein [Xanthomonas populi]